MKRMTGLMMAIVLAGCGNGNSPAPTAAAPASAARPAGAIAIANGDFEQSASDGSIPGWTMMQHAGVPSYDAVIEPSAAHGGKGGFRMTRTHEQVYGSLLQEVELPPGTSGAIELSAMLKAKDVGPEGWKLMLIADEPVYSAGLTGTSDWQRQSVRVTLKPNTRTVRIGVTLLDGGSGFADDVELRAVAM